MDSFFKVKTVQEVLEIAASFDPVGDEATHLPEAFGRVLSEDVSSPEDLPSFPRSAMDGYAVRARDTYGASEGLPALLKVAGEISMGRSPERVVGPGEAVRISTGGMLPDGADAVVMIEYGHLMDERTLEVVRPVSPLENVIQPGDDFREKECVLSRGHRLRAQDLGVLAGLGLGMVRVFRRPRIGIISTGDEVVPMASHPGPGQVRDINTYTLSAFCQGLGAVPMILGLCPDRLDPLKALVTQGLAQSDSVWISGGSSVGTRDLTLQVLEGLPDFELLVHGISISPGKPTIMGRCGRKPVVGLPGHAASALIVAEVIMAPLVSRLSGETELTDRHCGLVKARLSRNVESAPGREDYVRVRLSREGDQVVAEPIFGKSGLISPLVEAHGLIRIDMNTEGLYQGDMVSVIPFDARSGGFGEATGLPGHERP
jgi:molybdopterin molybdotransferase